MKKLSERESVLMSALRQRGRLSVAEAVELVGISEATARREFARLEQEGKAVRNYGGVRLPVPLDNYSFDRYKNVYEVEKRRIGETAAQLVENGDSIYLDCGTTVLRMAEALQRRIVTGEVGSLNIVTNSVVNLDALADSAGCRVILLGGEYNHERRDFSGPISERCMEMFHFRKCFLGSEGWSEESGFSSNHLGVSSMNTKAIGRSEKRYVLMDDSKFGKAGLISFAQTEQIDAIITDKRPGDAMLAALEAQGVDVLIAEEQRGGTV